MQTYRFKNYYRHTLVGALIARASVAEDLRNRSLGDPTLQMWTARPLRVLYPYFAAEWLNSLTLKVKYAAENAKITAFQETKDGIVHIGRAEVIKGEAIMPVVQRPVAGAPIQFVASLDDDVSLKLTR